MENGHRHIDSIFSTKLLVLGDAVEYKATFKVFEVSVIKGFAILRHEAGEDFRRLSHFLHRSLSEC